MIKEKRFFVKGMHCASCEILVEKKLLEIKGVKSVEASTNQGEALVEYVGQLPSADVLNKIFSEEGYSFSDREISKKRFSFKDIFQILAISLLIIIGFVAFQKTGLTALVNVTKQSSLPLFFVFGLLAGVSSCAALVGGMILSMAKQWGDGHRPHLLFNLGRLITFFLLGTFLGVIGSKLQLSLSFTSVLVIGVSLLMVVSGLQLLGLRLKFWLMPKAITRFIAKESNFQGRWLPILLGALTFFLPCGFTLTAQSSALLSGNGLQGGLIMLAFALGTLPMLLLIGLTSTKLFQNPHLSTQFSKIAGLLILFFAFYNLNSQFNRLGLPSLSDFGYQSKATTSVNIEGLPPLVKGKQVIKMDASSQNGYLPNYFKVRAGVPVRWEITDKGTNGCTNAVIAAGLFSDKISLTPGQVSVKEFTPQQPGRYKFSCWMGMVSGVIEVVGPNSTQEVSSGAQGCGCGGK